MTTTTYEGAPKILMVPLHLIDPGDADKQRANRSDARIHDLAQSIERLGIITPLLLRPDNGRYQTLAGGYRREAARMAGLKEVPAILIHTDDDHAWALSTTENLQRTDLSPLEEAEIIRISHVERHQSLAQIAHDNGRSESWVQDRLDMLAWSPDILQAVHHARISKAAAAPIAGVDNPNLRTQLLTEAIRFGATARVTMNWVRTAKLVAQHPTADDVTRITNAPGPPTQRLICTCWICRKDLEIQHISHLPTCPLCIQAIHDSQTGNAPTTHADSSPTARPSSSDVTPA